MLSLPGTVSTWNPKAVRASAGSVFRMPLIATSPEEGFTRLRAAGVTIWTTAVQGAEPANGVDLAGPVALVIGNEGNGVPEDLAEQADGAITIPCPGPVESLNAAVAASVLLYEASRQRTGASSNLSHPSQKARRMGHPDSVRVGYLEEQDDLPAHPSRKNKNAARVGHPDSKVKRTDSTVGRTNSVAGGRR
jgi:tRNA(Leu) C34 or U34 (ribose-2'-O)-methylase TrmL